MLISIFLVWRKPHWKMGTPPGLQARRRRRGRARYPLALALGQAREEPEPFASGVLNSNR